MGKCALLGRREDDFRVLMKSAWDDAKNFEIECLEVDAEIMI